MRRFTLRARISTETSAAAAAFALVACLFQAGSAEAQPRGPEPDRPEHFIGEHADELGLDEGTRTQIEEIVLRSRREAEKLRRAHHQAGRTLRQLLELDEPDEASVMQQADVVGSLESQRLKQRIGSMLEIRALLTPEQRRRLVEIREADGGDRPGRRERREQMRACEPDVRKMCPDADHPRAVFRCLEREREALTPECTEAFDSLRSDMEERRGRHRRGRDDRL
jgi:Spy/CpxP family protein refolding chaperone